MIEKNDLSKVVIRTVVILSVCLMFASGIFAAANVEPCLLSEQTLQELKTASQATGKYHSLTAAQAEGYFDTGIFVEHMGEHYLNQANLDDAIFDPKYPELLVYADIGNGQQRLVAVEYAVKISDSPFGPPEGFTGDCDHWDRNETYGLWTQHAWIWYSNPDGVFNDLNSRIP
jgi:hypothetical protein